MKYNFMFLLKNGQKYYRFGTIYDALQMYQNILKHFQDVPFVFVWSSKDLQFLACSLKVPFSLPEV